MSESPTSDPDEHPVREHVDVEREIDADGERPVDESGDEPGSDSIDELDVPIEAPIADVIDQRTEVELDDDDPTRTG